MGVLFIILRSYCVCRNTMEIKLIQWAKVVYNPMTSVCYDSSLWAKTMRNSKVLYLVILKLNFPWHNKKTSIYSCLVKMAKIRHLIFLRS